MFWANQNQKLRVVMLLSIEVVLIEAVYIGCLNNQKFKIKLTFNKIFGSKLSKI